MGWTRITVLDLETSEEEAVEIRDDYVLVCVGDCHLEHTNVHANGTHILTVKGSKGEKRAPSAPPATDAGEALREDNDD